MNWITCEDFMSKTKVNKANTGPRSAAWFLKFLNKSIIFYSWINKLAVAPLIERLAGELKGPSSSLGFGLYISLELLLKREMNQMVNKNNYKNSSNSLVFGRWPQTNNVLKLKSVHYLQPSDSGFLMMLEKSSTSIVINLEIAFFWWL